MCRVVSANVHLSGFGFLLYWRMYRMSFLSMPLIEVKTPRVMTSRWMRANQFSTWFNYDEYVGV